MDFSITVSAVVALNDFLEKVEIESVMLRDFACIVTYVSFLT